MTAPSKRQTVYAVLYHDDRCPGGGAYGDGSFIARFRSREKADKFAAEHHYCGKPATVDVNENVPTRLLARWTFQG